MRTDHLGDMLLTLPMVQVLKAADPDCRVSVLASAANADAARHHPDVDHVEVDPREAKGSGLGGVWSLARQLRRLGCDAAVVVHPTPRLALAVYLARIPVRVGTAYRAYSVLFNRRVRQHRRRPPWKHESEYNVDLLRPLGVEAQAPASGSWRVLPDEAAAIDVGLQAWGLRAGRFVVLHPGNAGSAMNWSPEQYAELGRRLLARQGLAPVQVVITGGPSEVALTGQVAQGIGAQAVDLGGQLTVGRLAALLSRCALYVGSATGPTHLAAAVGVPVIALYSPLHSSAPPRWRPLGPHVNVVQPAVDLLCPKCLGQRCPYFHCMQRHLSVDTVADAAERVLDVSLGKLDRKGKEMENRKPKTGN